MINEKRFAETFTSFWNVVLPLSNSAIKNLKTISHTVTDAVDTEYIKSRRAFINHFAFNIFKHSIKVNKIVHLLDNEVINRIHNLTQKQLNAFISKDLPDLRTLNAKEIEEALLMAENIETFFATYYKAKNKILVNPLFNGCGIIKNCFGDVIVNNNLFEIKATKKFFEPKDIRQLLVYCALNSRNKKYDIENIGIYNPKVGQYFKIGVDELCLMASGKESTIIFNDIINFISNYDVHN